MVDGQWTRDALAIASGWSAAFCQSSTNPASDLASVASLPAHSATSLATAETVCVGNVLMQRMLFERLRRLHRYVPNGGWLARDRGVQVAAQVRLEGPLDLPCFGECFQRILRRDEMSWGLRHSMKVTITRNTLEWFIFVIIMCFAAPFP